MYLAQESVDNTVSISIFFVDPIGSEKSSLSQAVVEFENRKSTFYALKPGRCRNILLMPEIAARIDQVDHKFQQN